MNLEYFPQFIRYNFKSLVSQENEVLLEIGTAFKMYLKETILDKEALNKIWNIDPKNVIINQANKNPFYVNGYHPALIMHFHQFSDIMIKIGKADKDHSLKFVKK